MSDLIQSIKSVASQLAKETLNQIKIKQCLDRPPALCPGMPGGPLRMISYDDMVKNTQLDK
ncbi:hypothetical protein ACT42U_12820 [Acinetobacter baumannii]